MPGTEIPEAVANAVTALSTADRSAVMEALQSSAPGLWQAIFQKGHNVGYGQRAGEMEAMTSRATAAEAKVQTLTQELTTARATGPADVNQLHTDYQRKLAEKDTAHASLMARLEAQSLRATQTALQAELVDLGVDREYAAVLSEKPEVVRRLKAKEDQPITVLQAGTEIPIVPAGDKSPLQIMADELKAKVPNKFIVSNVDAGAGTSGTGGGADGHHATPESKVLDTIAANKKAELERDRAGRDAAEKALSGLSMTPAGL